MSTTPKFSFVDKLLIVELVAQLLILLAILSFVLNLQREIVRNKQAIITNQHLLEEIQTKHNNQ